MSDHHTSTASVGSVLRAVDALAIVLLGAVAASPLAYAYDGNRWLVATFVALVVGVGIAWLGTRFALSAWPTALLVAVGYLVLGSGVALPQSAAAGVLPTLSSLRELATGIVTSWRNALTLTAPMNTDGGAMIVPFALALLAGTLTATVLWRSRLPGVAVLVLMGLFVAATAFGTNLTGMTFARGMVLAVVGIVWIRMRALRGVRAHWSRRIALTVVVIVGAGLTAGALAAATEVSGQRSVLRDHVDPPFDPRDYPSPLSAFRQFRTGDLKDKKIFTVDGLDSSKASPRIRLATMDAFDGVVWNVAGGKGSVGSSGSFTPFVPGAYPSSSEESVSITIGDLPGVWVPTVGYTNGVTTSETSKRSADVYFNTATGTMAQDGLVRKGTTYTFTTSIDPDRTPEQVGAAVADSLTKVPPLQSPPEDLIELVGAMTSEAKSANAGAIAAAVSKGFAKNGYFSDGAPYATPSGHSSWRLAKLASEEQMLGNEEQYAAAMGVGAQSLNLPARVVMGFQPKGNGSVLGKDVSAWVEVNLDGLGWVPFEPTPDKDRRPQIDNPDPNPEPQPQVLQPPTLPEEPVAPSEDSFLPPGTKGRGDAFWLLSILAVLWKPVGSALLLLAIPATILLAKGRRRKGRRLAEDLTTRVSGGWREITDVARDLGTPVAESQTRHEAGTGLAERYPDSDVASLAWRADAHVFGPVPPSGDEAAAYWADVGTALVRMRKSTPRWRGILARFSLSSLPIKSRILGGWRFGSARIVHMGDVFVARLRSR